MEWKIPVRLVQPVINVDHLQRWSLIVQLEGAETDLFSWLPPKISRIFVIKESTHYLDVKSQLTNMTRAPDKEKIWVPVRNRTHDLPNTRRVLYPLSSRTHGEQGFSFVPCSCYVNQFTFHFLLPRLKFTIFSHLLIPNQFPPSIFTTSGIQVR